MARLRIAALALPAAAIVAGFGGCDSGEDQLTAAALKQKADTICREEQSRFHRIQAQPPPNASIAADQTRRLIDVSNAAGSDLADLEPPDSLGGAYDMYLEAREHAVEQMKRGQKAAEDRDPGGYAAAQIAVAKTAPERRRLAATLGLHVCGANPRSG